MIKNKLFGLLYDKVSQLSGKYRIKTNIQKCKHFCLKNFSLAKSNVRKPNIATWLYHASLISDDALFRQRFTNDYGDEIYALHMEKNFMSCAFCTRLYCLGNNCCSICTLGKYEQAACLLPEPFTAGHHAIDNSQSAIPWIFKAPCEAFERIGREDYFRNFKITSRKQTIIHYEILQGLFLGICHQKKPCHICASIDKNIYHTCLAGRDFCESTPCSRVLGKLISAYSSQAACPFDMPTIPANLQPHPVYPS